MRWSADWRLQIHLQGEPPPLWHKIADCQALSVAFPKIVLDLQGGVEVVLHPARVSETEIEGELLLCAGQRLVSPPIED